MLWILSVCDYVQYSGDLATLVRFIPSIEDKLSKALAIYNRSADLSFYGPDDRWAVDMDYTAAVYKKE